MNLISRIPIASKPFQLRPRHMLRRAEDNAFSYDPKNRIAKITHSQVKQLCDRVEKSFPGYCRNNY